MMSDPVMNSETEDKIVMDHALEVLQTQLRELQTNYDTLMQAHTSQRATAVDTVWRYLPQHSTDFRQIPALDPNMRETETCAGNYSFGQVLGHGKYCTVRKCARMIAVAPTSSSNSSAQTQQQQRPPGRLAVKIFRKEDVLAASQLLKIERELCVLSAISKSNGHCNVIEFVDCLHARNCLYVVLEACPMDLFEFISCFRSSVDSNTCAVIMREITSGLKFMSEHSVCHGDLKPENVLIDVRESQFVVKLCDFALSSHFDGSTSMVNKEFCGTPGFFAPEVLVEKQYCGYLADIFSLGCIFIEMMVEPNAFSRHWLGAFSKAQSVLGCPNRSREDFITDFVMDVKVGIDWAEAKIKKSSSLFPSAECQQVFLSMIRFVPTERSSLDVILESEWSREANQKLAVDRIAKKLKVRSGELDSAVLLEAKNKYLAAKAEKTERMAAAKAALAAFSAARINQVATQSSAVKSNGFFAGHRCSNIVISAIDVSNARKKSRNLIVGSAADDIPAIDKVESSVSPRPSSSIVTKVKLAPIGRKKSNPQPGSSMDVALSEYNAPSASVLNITARQPFGGAGGSRRCLPQDKISECSNSDSTDGLSRTNSDPATETPKSPIGQRVVGSPDQTVGQHNKRRSVCFDSNVSSDRGISTSCGRRASKNSTGAPVLPAQTSQLQRRLTFMPVKTTKN